MVKDLDIIHDLPPVFPLYPFRRKLDRRERVLDLMGNAPRDIAPGSHPLRRHKIGNIIKGHDEPLDAAAGNFRGSPHQKMAMPVTGLKLYLPLDHAIGPFPYLIEQYRHLRLYFGEMRPDQFRTGQSEKFRCLAVRQINDPPLIEPNHTGGDTGEHRLGKPPPFIQLFICHFQLRTLGAKLLGHTVESPAQGRHFIMRAGFIDLRRQITGADPFCRLHKALDRADNTRGNHQPEPDSRQHHHQRYDEEDDGKLDLNAEPFLLQGFIFRSSGTGSFQMREHPRLDKASDI